MSIEVSIKGKIFESVKAVARTFNVSYPLLQKYSKQYKISYEDAVELLTAREHKAKDHLGQSFKSLKEMCKAHGVTYYQFLYRINQGRSIAECLDPHICRPRSKSAVDHQGNKFKSISEMCRHYGVLKNTFSTRLSRGWSIKESLTGKEESAR